MRLRVHTRVPVCTYACMYVGLLLLYVASIVKSELFILACLGVFFATPFLVILIYKYIKFINRESSCRG